MPIYEYGCDACGHRFERWQKISEKPADRCESCGGTDVRKLISATSFTLKGSGWYATDYGGRSASTD